MAMTAADEHWQQLVTGALLGTDRRPPPSPPPGPLAEVVLERGGDHAQTLVEQVAATVAVRRAAFRPGAGVTALPPPPVDPRPEIPPQAIDHHAELTASWPVLEDEWLLAVVQGGWRLARELVVPLLVAHRADAVRRRRVEVAAGPLAGWAVEHLATLVPGLAPTRHRRVDPGELEAAVASLPDVPVPVELAAAITDPDLLEALVVEPLRAGRFQAAHRNVLVNLVARVPRSSLAGLAGRLDAVPSGSPSAPLALSLAHLAQLRHEMLEVLAAAPTPPDPPT